MSLVRDHYYCIGKSHLYCQDYTAQGETPWPTLVVADGCSSSLDSDIGARLLAHAALQVLAEKETTPDYATLGLAIVRRAERLVGQLGGHSMMLDSTLLIALHQEDEVLVRVYGDGFLLLEDHAGQCRSLEIAFEHNMPYYLNYRLDPGRQAAYAGEGEQPLLVLENGESTRHRYDAPLEWRFAWNEYRKIGIASDGVGHYVDVASQKLVPAADIAREILSLREPTADFLKRRIPKMNQRLAREDKAPLDDVAVALFARRESA